MLKKIGSFIDIILYNSPLNLISLLYSFTKSVSCLVNRFAVVIGSVVSRIAIEGINIVVSRITRGGVNVVVSGVITRGVNAVSIRIYSSVHP